MHLLWRFRNLPVIHNMYVPIQFSPNDQITPKLFVLINNTQIFVFCLVSLYLKQIDTHGALIQYILIVFPFNSLGIFICCCEGIVAWVTNHRVARDLPKVSICWCWNLSQLVGPWMWMLSYLISPIYTNNSHSRATHPTCVKSVLGLSKVDVGSEWNWHTHH